MSAGDVYRRAAELVDSGQYGLSCWAIDKAAHEMWTPERQAYDELFRPKNTSWTAWGETWARSYEVCQACRVLALLLMAAIADDEDKS